MPDPASCPGFYIGFLDGVSPDEFIEGAKLAVGARRAAQVPAESQTYELIVTHSWNTA